VQDSVLHREKHYDLVFEATGTGDGVDTALRLARRGGMVVLEGISDRQEPALNADLITLNQLRVQGGFGASSRAWSWVVDLFIHGQLDPAPLITHRYPLDAHQTAFATLQDPRAGAVKVQLLPNEESS